MTGLAQTETAPLAADSQPVFLTVEGLSHRFRERVALDGVGFEVRRGETLGLLGPNGAGKTTAFGMLAGLLPIGQGRVVLGGERLDPASPAFRRRIGVVFQSPSIDLKLSARENLLLGAALYGLPGVQARVRIDQALALMDLTGRAHEAAATYSGGLRRRLEIARVLLHDPELLLLDEPGQGIDPETLRRIWDQIGTLKAKRGVSVLLTTHQPDEAERCDRIAILDEGRIVATGTPDDLRARVSGDVVQVRGREPEDIAATVHARLGLTVTVIEGAAVIETGATTGASLAASGHQLVPRIAELFAPGRLDSVAVRRPTLADVFSKVTGRGLHGAGSGAS